MDLPLCPDVHTLRYHSHRVRIDKPLDQTDVFNINVKSKKMVSCLLLMIYVLLSYGNLVPCTKWGKIVTMLYAVFGIPVYVLYFLNMGKVKHISVCQFYNI